MWRHTNARGPRARNRDSRCDFPAASGEARDLLLRSGMSPAPHALSRFLRELACAPARAAGAGLCARARPGDAVGRFELVREIGRGGFGVVFEARDRELGGRVALKLLRSGGLAAAEREGLEREVEAGRLRHPNIVALLDSGSCDRGPYAVFEYLSGETVGERLRRGPLPVAAVLRVAAAVARALSHAHAHGVLHRDLKPGNVFLPSGAEAKLIDFGLARVAGSGGPPGSGTSGYMAPEQRRGEPEDARTDLFALGLLVHEMAAGEALLPRDEADGAGTPPPSPPAAGLPAALERLVADLVEREPARRPGSADDVLARLAAIRDAGGTTRRVQRRVARVELAVGA